MYYTVEVNGKDLGKQFQANSRAEIMDYLMISKIANPSRDTIHIHDLNLEPEIGKLLKGKFPMDHGDGEILRHLNNLILTYGDAWVKDLVCEKFNVVPKRQRKLKVA